MRNCASCIFSGVMILCAGQTTMLCTFLNVCSVTCYVYVAALQHLSVISDLDKIDVSDLHFYYWALYGNLQ
jgi:hypothetical protein